MTITTGPNLGVMEDGAAGDAHVTEFKLFLRTMDLLVQANVISATTVAQPGSPANGDAYILPTGVTGAVWAGNAGKIARWTTKTSPAQWDLVTAKEGWNVRAKDTDLRYEHNGTTWVASGGANGSLMGLYAARPAAAAAPNTVYYATDVSEAYFSNGATWTVIPCGGTELGYAEITAGFSTASSTPVDITGLTVTCKVGERPVVIAYGANMRNNNVGGFARVYGVANSVLASNLTVAGTMGYLALSRETRVSGLTPGSTYTFKLQMAALTTGTADVYADTNDRPYIQVRTS
jgi:hypothetical protein